MSAGPERFGPYLLVSLLGRGGMGEVWRAHDEAHDRTVALKRLLPALSAQPEFVHRFRREARSAADLDSAHVVPIHDWGEIDGQAYLVMRLIEGTDLEALLRAGSTGLAPRRAAELTVQLADALDTAHRAGVVHRDVKPSNVLVTRRRARDHCYLVDFGIAKAVDESGDGGLTPSRSTVGTPLYMAPELFDGSRAASTRSDVYALGATLHRALTATEPFPGPGQAALMHQHLHAPPPAPSATDPRLAPFDDVVARAMAKDPAERYASASELADAASAAAEATPAPDTTPWAPAEDGGGPGHVSVPTGAPPSTVVTVPGGGGDDPSAAPAPQTPPRGRRRVVAGAVAAVTVAVVAAAVIGVLLVTGDRTPAAAPAPPPAPVALRGGAPGVVPATAATVRSAGDAYYAFGRWPDACSLLTPAEITAAVPGATVDAPLAQRSPLSFDGEPLGRTPNPVTCLWPVRGPDGGTGLLRIALRSVGDRLPSDYENALDAYPPVLQPSIVPAPPPEQPGQRFPSPQALRGTDPVSCGAPRLDRSSYDPSSGVFLSPPGDYAVLLCLRSPQVLFDLGWHLDARPPVDPQTWTERSVPALLRVLAARIR